MLLKIFRCTLFLFILRVQFPDTVKAQEPKNALPTSESQEIPFEYADGHLISVRGSIGARTNLQFLVDFGTTYTLLDRHFADDITRNGQKMDVTHFSSTIETAEVVLPEFTIGPVPMKDFHAYLADLNNMPAVPSGIVGIVGLDLLQLHNVTIDFAEQKLYFTSHVTGRHQAPLEMCAVGVAINASWKGAPIKLALSTGVEVITLDQDRMKQGAYKIQKPKKGMLTSNFTVTPVTVLETKGLMLNDTVLRGPGILRRMQWPIASDKLDGFLPLIALGTNRVSLDFEHHLLFWDDPAPPIQTARLTTR